MDPSKSTQQQPEQAGDAQVPQAVKDAIKQHKAAPGPAVPKDFKVAEEGTKEERRAKAQELNK